MAIPTSDHRLAYVPLFADLSSEALSELAHTSWVRRYPKGQVLCSEGDAGNHLLVLESGRVKVSRFTSAGQEVVLATVQAPEAFGELALIDGAPRSATLTAQTAVIIRFVERQAFLGLIDREPAVAMALMRTLTSMVRETNERLADSRSLDVPGRLAKWLLNQTAQRGEQRPEGIAVPFDVSQSELAAELGTTRVTLNKALKGFEALGVLALRPGEILVLKADELVPHIA